MNANVSFSFYVNSNTIREIVLTLCSLSRQVFEISLNSSLITDELSSRGEAFKSFTIYSEKINIVSTTLNAASKSMIMHSTRLMEISLESTKQVERMDKIRYGLSLIQDTDNLKTVQKASDKVAAKINPLIKDLEDTIIIIIQLLEGFEQSLKKLWLLSNNLKAHVEKENVSSLITIVKKIEFVLDHTGGNAYRLNGCLKDLLNQLHNLEIKHE